MMNKSKIPVTQKKLPKFRFMAMSKLIGLVAFGFAFMITIYAMYEMHITNNYDALPQLIISAFSFASVYAGFYLLMAKVEHVEEERTKREKELAILKEKDVLEEDIQSKKDEIEALRQKMNDLLNETTQSLL